MMEKGANIEGFSLEELMNIYGELLISGSYQGRMGVPHVSE
jgi:hypothetical protein